jgi:transposase
MTRLFAGIDWGGASHAACVVGDSGAVIVRFEVSHDAAGLATLIRDLARLASPAELPIAIERPSGLLVDTLVAAGYPVVPIHPNVVKACRPRYRAAGGKHDLGDAYLLADVLRTDGHRFTRLAPQSDAIKALRALVRARDDLVAERVALANQLRAQLEGYWPGAVALFCEIDSPIALAFVKRYPTPSSAEYLGEKRLAAFLTLERYSGRCPAAELLGRLRGAPRGQCAAAEADARGELTRSFARILETLGLELTKLNARIEHELASLADGQLLMSFPRAGRINAAQILAELGDVRERFQTEEQLAAEAGVCPVTHQSGKSRGVTCRWACNHRLRRALTTWAGNTRHASSWAAQIYRRARERGCRHPHAVRILARAWVRVLWRAWTNHTAYDPNKHRSAIAVIAA